MEEVLQFLKESPVFYLATMEEDQPRVRPFGAVAVFDGKLYICTNNKKKVFEQMMQNSKIEICSLDSKSNWFRLEAKAINDSRQEARAAMLEQNPGLNRMYKVDDGMFEVLYLEDATVTFYSYTSDPKTIKF